MYLSQRKEIKIEEEGFICVWVQQARPILDARPHINEEICERCRRLAWPGLAWPCSIKRLLLRFLLGRPTLWRYNNENLLCKRVKKKTGER